MTEIATRLRLAREAAGFATAADAAQRFGWPYPTYAGHENGHRGIRLDALSDYARAFKVTKEWLLDGKSPPSSEKSVASRQGERAPGFAEPDLVRYRPPTATAGRAIDAAIATLAPGWRHLQVMISSRAWHAYAILAGDLVVIGTPPAAREGELVAATWPDPDSVTTIGQRTGDRVLLPPGEDTPDGEAGIMGAVALVIRSAANRG